MSDILSQEEIDNLMKALSSGELDVDEMKDTKEKQVKDYDFARPAKFSKEHLRTLEIIFEHYGRLLATNLPVYLRKNVQIEHKRRKPKKYLRLSLKVKWSFFLFLQLFLTNDFFEKQLVNPCIFI